MEWKESADVPPQQIHFVPMSLGRIQTFMRNPAVYLWRSKIPAGAKFRSVCKGGSLICEDDGEELSLEHGDLEILLGGMTESDYENTVR